MYILEDCNIKLLSVVSSTRVTTLIDVLCESKSLLGNKFITESFLLVLKNCCSSVPVLWENISFARIIRKNIDHTQMHVN